MIKVTHKKRGTYLVTLERADWRLVKTIADGYGMPSNAALASCINKGIDIHTAALRQGDDHDKLAEDTETSQEHNTT